MAESKKSLYRPSFPKKYKGDTSNIICRSSWERKFCQYCDLNESILEWGSEEFWIPYRSPVDNKTHRYFPDFIIKVKESTGELKHMSLKLNLDDKLNHLQKDLHFMKPKLMQLTKQNGKQQEVGVPIEELNLKL